MASTKKNTAITADDCMKIMKEHFDNTVIVDWYDRKLTITKVISSSEVRWIVNNVVDACFDKDGNYNPDVVELAMYSAIVGVYTDATLPNDTDDICKFIYGTDITDIVYKNACEDQLYYIRTAIDAKIDYLVQTNIKAINAASDRLADSMNQISNSLSLLFDGVNRDDIQNIMSAITGGAINEEKFLAAYAKLKDNPETV